MKKRIASLLLGGALALSCAACSNAADTPPASNTPAEDETLISLSDDGVQVNGEAASAEAASAVWVGGEIIYYQDGTDETYGEGSESEKHSAEEAAAHTVVTITQPGVYRLTGQLSRGQIFVDLGEDAKTDPDAVVTLILDNVDVTCTVAPAVFFYRVYECDTQWVAYDEGEADDYTASSAADTSAAGANVILAAGSENNITGSHVARIYKEGTTKKLHKYDGAFYSRMSMNIDGDNGDDSGVLNIVADNEGLDSELHLTINGGTVNIESQDDGINTNEDNVSVTTINGGVLTINAGLGAEGDGIDSNGYLTINGGTIWTMSNDRSPDGGIDADGAITINGGTLYAFGTRNDAADSASAQPYMELSFASTLPAGSHVTVADEEGNTVWEAETQKACQSITLTTPELALDTVYHVYVDGVLQCYSDTGTGGMGGFGGGGMENPPENFDPGEMEEQPEGFEPGEMEEPPEGFRDGDREQRPELPEGMADMTLPEDMENMTPPDDFEGGPQGHRGGMDFGQMDGDGSGETGFVLTETVKSFSGVCDSAESGKTQVTFTVEGISRENGVTTLSQIDAILPSVEGLSGDQIQITVTDDPSEDYAETCLLSEGLEAVNALLPGSAGEYVLTIAVVSGSETYTGATQVTFTVEGTAEE